MRGQQTNTDSRKARLPRDNGNDAGRFFATATSLARKGRYDEAAKLLQKALDAEECSKAEGLDLLARIYVQQGRHLDAESCWQEAKQLDESNPAYDDALNRLRRGRLSSRRVVHLATTSLAIAFLALLLWQLLFVNPNVYNRQHAAEASLTAIREDIATSQNASQERGLELATDIADLDRSRIERDSQLAKQLKALSTSSETAKTRDAVIARLDEQVAALQKVLGSQLASLAARHEQLDTAQIKKTEAVEASVADMAKALAAVEVRLGERIKKVEGVETAIRSDILSAAADLTAIGRAILMLQRQLAEIQAAIKQMKDTASQKPVEADGEKSADQSTLQSDRGTSVTSKAEDSPE